jgi:polyphenol oxidase
MDRFIAADPANRRFFVASAREAHFMFDLAGYVATRLAAAGVGAIDDLGACTYADPAQFYSYRRMTHRGEADYGRHINAIVLR